MSVFSDIKSDLGEIWASSNWTTRVLIAVSMFLSVSSIASLSDRVFELKGFIQTGIELYRTAIRTPFVDFASSLGLAFDVVESDTLVLLTLILVSVARASRARLRARIMLGPMLPGAERRETFIPISKRLIRNPSVRKWLQKWLTTILAFVTWIAAVVGFGHADVDAWALFWILLTVYIIGAAVLYTRISPANDEDSIELLLDVYAPREVLRLTTFKLFIEVPILSALIVLIVAAISEGWTRI